jgi:hypothetical protein
MPEMNHLEKTDRRDPKLTINGTKAHGRGLFDATIDIAAFCLAPCAPLHKRRGGTTSLYPEWYILTRGSNRDRVLAST